MRLLDKHGDGDIKPDHLRQYLATLNIKKESEILDELSPIPTIKGQGEKSGDKRVTFDMNRGRGRYETMQERNEENLLYKEMTAKNIEEEEAAEKKKRKIGRSKSKPKKTKR